MELSSFVAENANVCNNSLMWLRIFLLIFHERIVGKVSGKIEAYAIICWDFLETTFDHLQYISVFSYPALF